MENSLNSTRAAFCWVGIYEVVATRFTKQK